MPREDPAPRTAASRVGGRGTAAQHEMLRRAVVGPSCDLDDGAGGGVARAAAYRTAVASSEERQHLFTPRSMTAKLSAMRRSYGAGRIWGAFDSGDDGAALHDRVAAVEAEWRD